MRNARFENLADAKVLYSNGLEMNALRLAGSHALVRLVTGPMTGSLTVRKPVWNPSACGAIRGVSFSRTAIMLVMVQFVPPATVL